MNLQLGGRVAQGRANHLGRIDDTGFDEVPVPNDFCVKTESAGSRLPANVSRNTPATEAEEL